MAVTLIGCSEESNDDNNNIDILTPADENVEQYVGDWNFMSDDCTNRVIKIVKGQEQNQLIFDSISGLVKNKRLNASSPVATWIVVFSSESAATVDYNGGTCTGTLAKI